MSVSTSNRQASVNEIVAEMDRRGVVIERLEARIVELESQLRDAQARGKGMEEALAAAARDVLAERKRQIEVEGWTPEHDDEHAKGEMAYAAAAYAVHGGSDDHDRLNSEFWAILWPWPASRWKPSTRRRDLVNAGALILAAIEQLDRAALSRPEGSAST